MISIDIRLVEKELRRLPSYVVDKFYQWIEAVYEDGIREVRKVPGYHDEPLKGSRLGQRSVRLTKAYRVIYSEHKNGEIEIILVREVNKHDY